MSVLREKQDNLAEVERQITNLHAVYKKSVTEKKNLEANMALTAARLKRSSKLTAALADEQVRNRAYSIKKKKSAIKLEEI